MLKGKQKPSKDICFVSHTIPLGVLRVVGYILYESSTYFVILKLYLQMYFFFVLSNEHLYKIHTFFCQYIDFMFTVKSEKINIVTLATMSNEVYC